MEARTIIDLAIENLEKDTSFKARWLKEKVPGKIDGVISFRFGNKTIKLYFKVTKECRNLHLPQVEQLAMAYDNFLLIAYRITPEAKRELQKLDIPYLESNGNLFLHKEDLFIWLDHHKPLRVDKEKAGRAFTKTGLKVVFHLLRFQEDINLPYRTIAELTDTALGNVSNIVKGLKEQGFLLQLNDREFTFQNKKELLERWLTGYQQKLKPSLEAGSYRFLKQADFQDWKEIPLKSGKSWWGAEPAADLYTNFLKPEILTLYTLESRSELMKNYKLLPDPNGHVQVYQKFWKKDEVEEMLVPPLLVYADLITTRDRRCLEAAEKLYNEYLQDKL